MLQGWSYPQHICRQWRAPTCFAVLFRLEVIAQYLLSAFLFTEQPNFLTAVFSEKLPNAVPGIVVQLTLIPTIMVALNRTGLVIFQRKQPLENLAVR